MTDFKSSGCVLTMKETDYWSLDEGMGNVAEGNFADVVRYMVRLGITIESIERGVELILAHSDPEPGFGVHFGPYNFPTLLPYKKKVS